MILTIPYVAGLSESIQRRDFDIKTAFKLGKTLRSHLTKAKDTIPITTESSICETTRRLEQRVKEHRDACKKVSAIAEHAWHGKR